MIRRIKRHASAMNEKAHYVQVMYFNFASANNSLVAKRRVYKESTPKQKKLNEKRAKRYFEALVEANFKGGRDLHLTLTFSDETYPADEREAKKRVRQFIQNINRKRRRRGLENAKYIIVFETSKKGRFHFHILMDGKLDRESVEASWTHGYCNADRLRYDFKEGLSAIIKYLSKGGGKIDGKKIDEPKVSDGRDKWSKRWIPSQGLIRPWLSEGKSRLSEKKFRDIVELPTDCEDFIAAVEGDNPGYFLQDVEKTYCEQTGGWYIFCRMRLNEPVHLKDKGKNDSGAARN